MNEWGVGQSPTFKARITTDPPVGGELSAIWRKIRASRRTLEQTTVENL